MSQKCPVEQRLGAWLAIISYCNAQIWRVDQQQHQAAVLCLLLLGWAPQHSTLSFISSSSDEGLSFSRWLLHCELARPQPLLFYAHVLNSNNLAFPPILPLQLQIFYLDIIYV